MKLCFYDPSNNEGVEDYKQPPKNFGKNNKKNRNKCYGFLMSLNYNFEISIIVFALLALIFFSNEVFKYSI